MNREEPSRYVSTDYGSVDHYCAPINTIIDSAKVKLQNFIAKILSPPPQHGLRCPCATCWLNVTSPLEPRYTHDTSSWKIVAKYPFLDPARWISAHVALMIDIRRSIDFFILPYRSHRLLRALYVLWLSWQHTNYAEYILLLNKKLLTNS